MTNESGLQPMQVVQCPDALDRGARPAVIGSRKRETGFDPASVCQHGACSTCSHVAALFGTGHTKLVPENIQERGPAWSRDLVIPTVYLERNIDGRARRHEVSSKLSCRSLTKAHPPGCQKFGWDSRRPSPHSTIIAYCARSGRTSIILGLTVPPLAGEQPMPDPSRSEFGDFLRSR